MLRLFFDGNGLAFLVEFNDTKSFRVVYIADYKCLCKSIRAWLYSVSKRYAELMTVTKKLLETWGILWSGNDQDITDPCVHKNGHWIVDHWFIINWQ